MTAALELEGIRKAYGGRELWPAGIGLRVLPGETVGLVGPNGSGKSTLLRIAATHLRPSSGTVRILGHDARADPAAARKALGFAAQDAPAYQELGVREHLAWWLRLHGRGRAEARDGAAAAAEAAGLGRVGHARAAALSRGQRQRLALAMATVHDPPLLLLDEPFTALDAAGQAWAAGLVARRRGQRATVLALHGEADVERLCDRVVRLGPP